MKPFIVLLIAFFVSLLSVYFFTDASGLYLSGRIAMSCMLLFTSIGHFAFTKGMAMMMPDWIPAKKLMVYFTGLVEIAAAIGLLVPETVRLTGVMLIIFFILMLPVNVHAAVKKVDYQKGTYTGDGLNYLWFRVPLQLFFIVWVYWCAVQPFTVQ